MIALASSVRPVAMRRCWPIWRPCAVDVWRGVAIVIAVVALIGWGNGHEALTTWGGRSEMVPNTAVCVVLLALAAASRSHRRVMDSMTYATDGLALAAGLLAIMVILQLETGADLFIVNYTARLDSGVTVPGRMGIGTAVSIVLLAIGTGAPAWLRRCCGVLAILALAVGYTRLIDGHGHTAVPTIVALGLLALASIKDRRHV